MSTLMKRSAKVCIEKKNALDFATGSGVRVLSQFCQRPLSGVWSWNGLQPVDEVSSW